MEIEGIYISQYINGELNGQPLAAFEAKIKADKDLQLKVKIHQDIDTILMKNYLDLDDEELAKERQRLQPVFDEIKEKYFKASKHGEISSERRKRQRSNILSKWPLLTKRLFSVALAFVITALLLFFFNPVAYKLSPNQLADKYFEPATTNSLMGPGDNPTKSPKELLAKASHQYQNKQLNEAIQTFQKVADNGSKVYKQKANWYLALCYLKQNQPEHAIPLLEELKNNSNYKEDVKAILKQLK